jgi:hypothetical protein
MSGKVLSFWRKDDMVFENFILEGLEEPVDELSTGV